MLLMEIIHNLICCWETSKNFNVLTIRWECIWKEIRDKHWKTNTNTINLQQSADVNPIELVWDELDHIVAQLWQLLQESWAELSSLYLQSWVERMPRISEAVRATKGGHFDESNVYNKFRAFWFNLYLI